MDIFWLFLSLFSFAYVEFVMILTAKKQWNHSRNHYKSYNQIAKNSGGCRVEKEKRNAENKTYSLIKISSISTPEFLFAIYKYNKDFFFNISTTYKKNYHIWYQKVFGEKILHSVVTPFGASTRKTSSKTTKKNETKVKEKSSD